MLESIQIKNFRCLKSVETTLRPLTVLLGENDTGKSTFLAAIQALFVGGDLAAQDHWRCELSHVISMNARGQSRRVALSIAESARLGPNLRRYVPSLDGKAALPEAIQQGGFFGMHPAGVMPPVRPAPILRDSFSGGPALFTLPATGPTTESKGQPDDAGPPDLGSDGTGLSALIDYLLRHDRARFNALEDALRQRLPDLKDLTISTPRPEARALTFRMTEDFELPESRTSVGARLLVFFLALSYHPSPPGIILLEEPENGVHPRRLEDVLRLLRDITKGVHCGHPAQVILTTHSPYLLDHVNLDEDEVLVFRRNDDGSRTCEPVDRERLKAFLDDFMLGEVWFNQKEEGLIKRGGG